MKTCETCQGTGQVAEPIKAGDYVETKRGALGVVCSEAVNRILDKEYGRSVGEVRYLCISGAQVGDTYTCQSSSLTVRHGHIHIDR